jgi:hypothetical protein
MARSGQPPGQGDFTRSQVKRQVKDRVGKAGAGYFKMRLKPRGLGACIQGAAPFNLAASKPSAKAIKPKLAILQHQGSFGSIHGGQAQNRDARGTQREITVHPRQNRQGERFLIRQVRPGQGQILGGKPKREPGSRSAQIKPSFPRSTGFLGDQREER